MLRIHAIDTEIRNTAYQPACLFLLCLNNLYTKKPRPSKNEGRGLNSRYHPDSCILIYRHSKLCNVQHTTFSTFHIRTYPFSWLSLRCFLSKMQLTCEFQSLSELKRTFSRWFSLSARKQVSTVHDLRFSNLINFSYSKWIYQSILTQHFFLSSLNELLL